jgi:hypothetical protein
MIIIVIILGFVGLAYLCWLLLALAVNALPLFVGISVGLATYRAESGPIGAIVVGAIVGSVVLGAARVAISTFRSRLIRAAIALLFAIPAGVAGYQAALGLAHIGIPAEGWRQVIAVAGAIILAATAWARIAFSSWPDAGLSIAAGVTAPDPVTSGRAEPAAPGFDSVVDGAGL